MTEHARSMPGHARRGIIPPILCYHKIESRLELGVTRLSPRRFAKQVERLAKAGWRTLTLAETLACAEGTRVAGPREIAITFDDAYRGLRDHAFPVLADLGFTATCFVIADYAGRLNRWDVAYGGRRFAHLAWRDMRRWQDRGMEFQSHTLSHPRLSWAEDSVVRRELAESRRSIARALDVVPCAISYPFGAAGKREFALARDAGYTAGFALASRWRGDVMEIPRLPVYPWSPPTPGVGALAPLEWLGARGANRCAVGTTLWQRFRARRTAKSASSEGIPPRQRDERVG